MQLDCLEGRRKGAVGLPDFRQRMTPRPRAEHALSPPEHQRSVGHEVNSGSVGSADSLKGVSEPLRIGL